MVEFTKIEWAIHTFNLWWGCMKVSEGCANCYAEALDHRVGGEHWGPGATYRIMGEKYWAGPLKWNKEAEAAKTRDRVFCSSMADVFDENGPGEVRERLWGLIESTPHLIWMLLTKRPQNIERMLPESWLEQPRDNVWLGCTAELHHRGEQRIPTLLRAPAVRHFVSAEPLLGRVTLRPEWFRATSVRGRIDWVIAGAESGRSARPMDVNWVRALRDACINGKAAFFYKQKVSGGIKISLPELDGRTWADFPPVEAP